MDKGPFLHAGHLELGLSCALLIGIVSFIVSCGGDSEEHRVPPACSPREPVADREPEAEALLTLIEDHRSLALDALPGRELKQITALAPEGINEIGFLYADDDGNGAYIFQDGAGWRVSPDTPVSPALQFPTLSPSDLRHGMTSIVTAVEAQAPDIDVHLISLNRNEDCQLEWLIGGRQVDSEGKFGKIVEGVVPDATASFEETRRYDFPNRP